jgi:hypothetical protein
MRVESANLKNSHNSPISLIPKENFSAIGKRLFGLQITWNQSHTRKASAKSLEMGGLHCFCSSSLKSGQVSPETPPLHPQ